MLAFSTHFPRNSEVFPATFGNGIKVTFSLIID